jgi:hypothetical protein
MRKGKDLEPALDPDPSLGLMDLDLGRLKNIQIRIPNTG